MMKPEMAGKAAAAEAQYKGVRRRKWGRWVSEIRLPNSRERIWLGSYDSPEKAARAFDAAAVILRGRRARLNFPSAPPRLPRASLSLTPDQIKLAAAHHANDLPPPLPAADFPPPPPPHPPADSSAGESPAVSSSEVSDGLTTESNNEPLDWSFMDLLTSLDMQPPDFPTMDEFAYELFPPVAVPPPPPPDTAEENAASSSSSFLWNF